MKKNNFIAVMFSMVVSNVCLPASAQDIPVATDSRIKTFVYNENDVFNIVMRYGYQTNIEFSNKEAVDTISVGERSAWQIAPVGSRIFIRPMQENAHTNMTVITNKRTYQFDLQSTSTLGKSGEELAYVIRFFYPDEKKNKLSNSPSLRMSDPIPVVGGGENYKYTYSGSEEIAPSKVYDDGNATYFKFSGKAPSIARVDGNGNETPLNAYSENGYTVVDGVSGMYAVHSNGKKLYVFNEKLSVN